MRTLEQFVVVAEELHFHRAAARLNMSQPPLTHAIRKLEDELGVILIKRDKRVLGLTDAGRTFLEQARETLRQAEQAVTATRDVAAGRTGVVRLGYVGSALYGRLPTVIRQFRSTYPKVRLELREATTAAQITALRDRELDAGVLIPPLTNAQDIAVTPFDHDRLCLALSRDHPLSGHSALALAELADEPFVLWPRVEGSGFYLRVVRLCADAGFVPRVAQEAHGMHAVLSLVAVGVGVAIVPESMKGFREDWIRYHPLPAPGAAFELVLAARDPSPPVRALVRSFGASG
ncbi:LysR substrate-binding domain-containing protein [Alcanivoracaceae bacterium MT1]